jgi:uncharacterized protein DUF6285
MRDEPRGDQLLDTARAVLREALIPALPADRRHAALMVANAMSIAMRQLQAGDEPERLEATALQAMLGDVSAGSCVPPASGARARLAALNRQLCECIRDGRADEGPFHEAVRRHLLAAARGRVAESNPKYLGSGE